MKRIIFRENLYSSSTFYVLKQLGLIPGAEKAKFFELGKQISSLGKSFDFKASLSGGPLYYLMFHIPSYLEITPIEFDKYFQTATEFIKTKNINVFKNKWPNKTEYFDEWFVKGWINSLSNSIDHDPSRALALVETYLLILHDLWDEYSQIYRDKFNALNLSFSELEEKFNSIPIFDIWEDSFNQQYPYNYFEIDISPESDYPISRIGPEKIIIKSDKTNSFHAAVHEIGFRTINMNFIATNEYTKNLMIDDFINVVKIMDAEVCFRKELLFPQVDQTTFVKYRNLTHLLDFRRSKKAEPNLAKSFSIWYKELKELNII